MKPGKLLFLVLCTLRVVKCNVLPASDSRMLMKILETVDAATSDEHLFDATLQLLKSLCVCMRKTLKTKEDKLQLNLDSSLPTKDSNNERKLDIYREIYNNTCFHLHYELTNKFRRQQDNNNEDFVGKSTASHEIDSLNDVKNINNRNIKLYFEKLMYKTLIETKELHSYTIKRSNLYRKPILINNDISQQNMIFIISLSPKIHVEHIKESEEITYEDVKSIINSNKSRVDIDIFNTKFYDVDLEINNKITNVTRCNLLSLYTFLMEKRKNDQINIIKLVNKTNSIKIYIDVEANVSKNGFLDICCANNTKLCEKRMTRKQFYPAKNESDIKKQNYSTFHNYKETINKIKNLVKLYEEKIKEQGKYSMKYSTTDSECIGTTEETRSKGSIILKNIFNISKNKTVETKNVSDENHLGLFEEKHQNRVLHNIDNRNTSFRKSLIPPVISLGLQQRDLISHSQLEDTVGNDLSTFDSLEEDNWIENKHNNIQQSKSKQSMKNQNKIKLLVHKINTQISGKHSDEDNMLTEYPLRHNTYNQTTNDRSNSIPINLELTNKHKMSSLIVETTPILESSNMSSFDEPTTSKTNFKIELMPPRDKYIEKKPSARSDDTQIIFSSVELQSKPTYIYKSAATQKMEKRMTPSLETPVITESSTENNFQILYATELSSNIREPQTLHFQGTVFPKTPPQNKLVETPASSTHGTTRTSTNLTDTLAVATNRAATENKTPLIPAQRLLSKVIKFTNKAVQYPVIARTAELMSKLEVPYNIVKSMTLTHQMQPRKITKKEPPIGNENAQMILNPVVMESNSTYVHKSPVTQIVENIVTPLVKTPLMTEKSTENTFKVLSTSEFSSSNREINPQTLSFQKTNPQKTPQQNLPVETIASLTFGTINTQSALTDTSTIATSRIGIINKMPMILSKNIISELPKLTSNDHKNHMYAKSTNLMSNTDVAKNTVEPIILTRVHHRAIKSTKPILEMPREISDETENVTMTLKQVDKIKSLHDTVNIMVVNERKKHKMPLTTETSQVSQTLTKIIRNSSEKKSPTVTSIILPKVRNYVTFDDTENQTSLPLKYFYEPMHIKPYLATTTSKIVSETGPMIQLLSNDNVIEPLVTKSIWQSLHNLNTQNTANAKEHVVLNSGRDNLKANFPNQNMLPKIYTNLKEIEETKMKTSTETPLMHNKYNLISDTVQLTSTQRKLETLSAKAARRKNPYKIKDKEYTPESALVHEHSTFISPDFILTDVPLILTTIEKPSNISYQHLSLINSTQPTNTVYSADNQRPIDVSINIKDTDNSMFDLHSKISKNNYKNVTNKMLSVSTLNITKNKRNKNHSSEINNNKTTSIYNIDSKNAINNIPLNFYERISEKHVIYRTSEKTVRNEYMKKARNNTNKMLMSRNIVKIQPLTHLTKKNSSATTAYSSSKEVYIKMRPTIDPYVSSKDGIVTNYMHRSHKRSNLPEENPENSKFISTLFMITPNVSKIIPMFTTYVPMLASYNGIENTTIRMKPNILSSTRGEKTSMTTDTTTNSLRSTLSEDSKSESTDIVQKISNMIKFNENLSNALKEITNLPPDLAYKHYIATTANNSIHEYTRSTKDISMKNSQYKINIPARNSIEAKIPTMSPYSIIKTSSLSTDTIIKDKYQNSNTKENLKITSSPTQSYLYESSRLAANYNVTKFQNTKAKEVPRTTSLIENSPMLTARRKLVKYSDLTTTNQTLNKLTTLVVDMTTSSHSYNIRKNNQNTNTMKNLEMKIFHKKPYIDTLSSSTTNDFTRKPSSITAKEAMISIWRQPVTKYITYINEKTTKSIPIRTTKKQSGANYLTKKYLYPATNFNTKKYSGLVVTNSMATRTPKTTSVSKISHDTKKYLFETGNKTFLKPTRHFNQTTYQTEYLNWWSTKPAVVHLTEEPSPRREHSAEVTDSEIRFRATKAPISFTTQLVGKSTDLKLTTFRLSDTLASTPAIQPEEKLNIFTTGPIIEGDLNSTISSFENIFIPEIALNTNNKSSIGKTKIKKYFNFSLSDTLAIKAENNIKNNSLASTMTFETTTPGQKPLKTSGKNRLLSSITSHTENTKLCSSTDKPVKAVVDFRLDIDRQNLYESKSYMKNTTEKITKIARRRFDDTFNRSQATSLEEKYSTPAIQPEEKLNIFTTGPTKEGDLNLTISSFENISIPEIALNTINKSSLNKTKIKKDSLISKENILQTTDYNIMKKTSGSISDQVNIPSTRFSQFDWTKVTTEEISQLKFAGVQEYSRSTIRPRLSHNVSTNRRSFKKISSQETTGMIKNISSGRMNATSLIPTHTKQKKASFITFSTKNIPIIIKFNNTENKTQPNITKSIQSPKTTKIAETTSSIKITDIKKDIPSFTSSIKTIPGKISSLKTFSKSSQYKSKILSSPSTGITESILKSASIKVKATKHYPDPIKITFTEINPNISQTKVNISSPIDVTKDIPKFLKNNDVENIPISSQIVTTETVSNLPTTQIRNMSSFLTTSSDAVKENLSESRKSDNRKKKLSLTKNNSTDNAYSSKITINLWNVLKSTTKNIINSENTTSITEYVPNITTANTTKNALILAETNVTHIMPNPTLSYTKEIMSSFSTVSIIDDFPETTITASNEDPTLVKSSTNDNVSNSLLLTSLKYNISTPKISSIIDNVLNSTIFGTTELISSLTRNVFANTTLQSFKTSKNKTQNNQFVQESQIFKVSNITLYPNNSSNVVTSTTEYILQKMQHGTTNKMQIDSADTVHISVKTNITASGLINTPQKVAQKHKIQNQFNSVVRDAKPQQIKSNPIKVKNAGSNHTINNVPNLIEQMLNVTSFVKPYSNENLKQNSSFLSKITKHLENKLKQASSSTNIRDTHYFELEKKYHKDLMKQALSIKNVSKVNNQKQDSTEITTFKSTPDTKVIHEINDKTALNITDFTATSLASIAYFTAFFVTTPTTQQKNETYQKTLRTTKTITLDLSNLTRLLNTGSRIINANSHKKYKTALNFDNINKNEKGYKKQKIKTKLHSMQNFIIREPIARHLVPITEYQNSFTKHAKHLFQEKHTTMNANIRSKIKTELREIIKEGNFFSRLTLPPSKERTVKYNTYQPTHFDDFDVSRSFEDRHADRLRQYKLRTRIIDYPQKSVRIHRPVDYLLSTRPTYYSLKTTERRPLEYRFTKHAFILPTTTGKTRQNELMQPPKTIKDSPEFQYNKKLAVVSENHNVILKNTQYLLDDPFAKTKMYPVPPKRQRKVMKRIKTSKKTKSEFSPQQYFVTNQNRETKTKPHWTPKRMNIHRPLIVESKDITSFESFNAAVEPRTYFRAKPLIIENPNDEDFYKAGNDGLTKKEKANFLFETLHTPDHKVEPVLEKPVAYISSVLRKPKYLRDRVDSIRNFIAFYPRLTTESHFWKDSVRQSREDSDNELILDPSMFLYPRIDMPETTTPRRKKKRGRTIFFLSPTVPYNRYF